MRSTLSYRILPLLQESSSNFTPAKNKYLRHTVSASNFKSTNSKIFNDEEEEALLYDSICKSSRLKYKSSIIGLRKRASVLHLFDNASAHNTEKPSEIDSKATRNNSNPIHPIQIDLLKDTLPKSHAADSMSPSSAASKLNSPQPLTIPPQVIPATLPLDQAAIQVVPVYTATALRNYTSSDHTFSFESGSIMTVYGTRAVQNESSGSDGNFELEVDASPGWCQVELMSGATGFAPISYLKVSRL
jgi:hypothetical protein